MGTTPKVPTPPDPRSVVYVIRSDKSGAPLLKIGTTTSLHRRLRELARRTQGPVTLLAAWPGDDTLERALHRACSADLVAGEWFRPSDQVLALVARMRGRAGAATPAFSHGPTFTAREALHLAPPQHLVAGGCGDAPERFAGTVRGASPATQIFPPWLAVEIHEGLTACGCVRRADGRAYAQGACKICHGAGVTTAARAA